MKDFLEKIGSNFFVAAFVPALGFLIICSVIFRPVIPRDLNSPQNSTFDPINPNGLLVLTMAVVIGFTLSSLNDFTNRFFQGDYLFERIPFFSKRQLDRAKIMKESVRLKRRDLLKLDASSLSEKSDRTGHE